jgi:regulator of protease activity HflC (stomatin/prohibitin superfamily)
VNKRIIKWIALGVIGILVLITGLNCCSVIDPTEEAVTVTLGSLGNDNIGQGLHFKAPYVQTFRKIDKNPIEYKKSIPLGEKALITKDGQSLGVDFTMTWKYTDGSAVLVAKRFSDKNSLYNLISNPCKQAFKSEIGKLEALEFVGKQDEVISKVMDRVTAETARLQLPIEILNIVIENINWDPGFEAQIKKTAEMRAQVEQANQAADQAAAIAQKKVREAKADADAALEKKRMTEAEAEAEANAELIKAQKAADAKRVEADALAYYNAKVAQNYQVEIKLKELEIELERAKKWDGRQVPEYIPLTAAGGIVNLPEKK